MVTQTDPHSNGSKQKRARTPALGTETSDIRSERSEPPKIMGHPGEVTGTERVHLARGFGAEILRLRKASGLTQQQTADLSGLSRPYLSRLERGHRRPTFDAVEALAAILAPSDVDSTVDRLAKLAADSMRESAKRRRKRLESRKSMYHLNMARRELTRAQTRVRSLRARGWDGWADQLEADLAPLERLFDEREQQARAELIDMGEDPDDPTLKRPKTTPRHFRKRSYGPKPR